MKIATGVESVSPLAVCVVLECGGITVWQRDLLSELDDSEFVELSVICVADEHTRRKPKRNLFRRWKAFDRNAFRKKLPDGRCSEDLAAEGIGRNMIHAEVPPDSVADALRGCAPKVVVWLLAERPPPAIHGIAGGGVWTLPNATNEATGYAELANRTPVTACRLVSLALDSRDDRILSTAYSSTDPLSLSRSMLAVRAKDRTLLMTMLRQVSAGVVPRDMANDTTDSNTPQSPPATFDLLSGLTKLYSRYALSLITRRFYYSHWQIAYRHGGDRLDQDGLVLYVPDHTGFWADPFVVSWRGKTALFFEELPEGETCGNIVVSEFEKGGAPGTPTTIVTRDYHLSYPFIFEFEGALYMTPESAAANKIEVLKCVEFPYRWEPHGVLMDGVKAYDPTLIEHNGRWWLFVAIEDNGNSSADELHLYHAPDPFGEWTPHPQNPVNSDVRCARPAGALYRENGELYRPAQDCSVRYGYALSVQKILRMTEEDYAEETVAHILPDWTPDSLGTHTVNQAAGITVYDSFTRCRRT